jgi:hypothetical protein
MSKAEPHEASALELIQGELESGPWKRTGDEAEEAYGRADHPE